MNKIKTTEKVSVDASYVTPEQLIENIQEAVENAKQKYGEDIELSMELDYEDCYGSISTSLYLEITRSETDDECNRRMKREQESLEYQRKQYEQLKAKFEPK